MTTQSDKDDTNTLFTVRDAERAEQTCKTGEPFKCGDFVRLEHAGTGKNLHSHTGVKAPLSQRQEVSGFGDDGSGDMGDDW